MLNIENLKDYHDLFCKIDALILSRDKINIAIDGMSGSGKTTFSNILRKLHDSNVFHMDDFFLRPELITKERLNEIGGNVDYLRFKQEVIKGILSNEQFTYQIYDCKSQTLKDSTTIQPKKINIIEGVYSMHPTLIDYYDLKLFMYTDDKTQSKRLLKRSGPLLYKRFINEWIPKESQYFNEMKIKEQSDIVIKINDSHIELKYPFGEL
mgnify:CR=1 FL=1|jgi:uridine kinase